MYTVYGKGQEIIDKDIPVPRGKPVVLTHYLDANLYHDMLNGKSVTGILHILNQTPIDWFSKKQASPETATYGAEFVASRTCVEQVSEIQQTLRYLGVPIKGKSYMFGDNQSVVDSSIRPDVKLQKRHNMLSYHSVRHAIAWGMCSYMHIEGAINAADFLSKHWAYSRVKDSLKAVLFWAGDTIKLWGA